MVYREDLTEIIRQIEEYITSNYLKSDIEYAKLGSVLNSIEYNIEEGEFDPDAIDVLIHAFKNYIRIMHPAIYQNNNVIKLIDKLSKAIRKK